MPKLFKKTIIAARTETTQNTAASIVAGDYFYAEDVNIEPVIELNPRNYAKGTLGTRSTVPGTFGLKVQFKTEMKGAASAGTPYAPIGSILQACGMTEVVVGGASVTYSPTSSPAASHFSAGKAMTIHANYDGLRFQVVGVVGKYKFSIEAGKIVMLEFDGMGVYATPSDVVFPTQTYSTVVPVKATSGSFSFDSYSAIIQKWEFDSGISIAPRPDVSSSFGILGYMITDRKPVGMMNPEHELQATFNWSSRLQAGTYGPISYTLGSSAGNIITFTANRAQVTGYKFADRAGVRTRDTTLEFHETSGDDEISIVFT